MKPRRSLCALSMTSVCLLISSCGGSENPLADPLKAKPDERLAGIWHTEDSGGVEYYHVGRAGNKLPPGIMRVVAIAHDKAGTIERPHELLVFSTTIGDKHYLNAIFTKDEKQDLDQLNRESWKPDLIGYYCLMKYEVKGDKLDIWIMDSGAQRRIIQSGKIKGTLEGDDDAMFTDTTENLVSLLASPAGEGLFEKEPTIRYERLK